MSSQSGRSQGGANKESFFEVVGLGFFAIAVLFGLIWFLSSHKIVYYSTPFLRVLGSPWFFADTPTWNAINEAYSVFRLRPRDIPLSNYASFANDCLRPLAVLFAIVSAGFLGFQVLVGGGGGGVRRRMAPMQAATEIAKIFPAIVPVLHLGPDLVADRLPLWRRQTFPEDVWRREKIMGEPLVAGNRFFTNRVEAYFRGGEVKDGPHKIIKSRRWSRTLGFQMVDLFADVKQKDDICFPDRFSAQGKAIFAILCAHAFGGRDGKADYQKACDQLNNSCRGQVNGLPNLTVAQWIFDKYRNDLSARQLFAVHHWENTYLFSLFLKAKISGKATHTDFIWLKPTDRFMFYSLNTVGRATPPVEAAATFTMFDYEVRCARLKRLPLRFRADGDLEHNIFVGTSVQALSTEFGRYQASTEDDGDWWKTIGTWSSETLRAENRKTLEDAVRAQKAGVAALAGAPGAEESAYDVRQRQQAEAEERQRTVLSAKVFGGGDAGDMF